MPATTARLGAAVVLAAAGLLAPASAYACSCVAAGPADHARTADVVLDGDVVGQDVSHPSWPAMSSGDPVTYRVEVRQVYKGRVGPVTLVHSVASSASCGVDVAVGRRYILYADRAGGGALHAGACDGTRPAGRAAAATVERTLGSPYPPDVTIRLPERHLATTVWGVGGAALALVAMVASGRAVRSRSRPESSGGDARQDSEGGLAMD